jgi:hypothetical protein
MHDNTTNIALWIMVASKRIRRLLLCDLAAGSGQQNRFHTVVIPLRQHRFKH